MTGFWVHYHERRARIRASPTPTATAVGRSLLVVFEVEPAELRRYGRPATPAPAQTEKGWKVDLSQFGAQTIRNEERKRECRLRIVITGEQRVVAVGRHIEVPPRPRCLVDRPVLHMLLVPDKLCARQKHPQLMLTHEGHRGTSARGRLQQRPWAQRLPHRVELTQSREVRELKTAQTQVVLSRGNVRDLPESRNRLILRCGQLEEHRSDSRHETRTYTSSPDPVTSAACTPRAARR